MELSEIRPAWKLVWTKWQNESCTEQERKDCRCRMRLQQEVQRHQNQLYHNQTMTFLERCNSTGGKLGGNLLSMMGQVICHDFNLTSEAIIGHALHSLEPPPENRHKLKNALGFDLDIGFILGNIL